MNWTRCNECRGIGEIVEKPFVSCCEGGSKYILKSENTNSSSVSYSHEEVDRERLIVKISLAQMRGTTGW